MRCRVIPPALAAVLTGVVALPTARAADASAEKRGGYLVATSDRQTGLGGWPAKQFAGTADFAAIFACLQSIAPVKNAAPRPIAPANASTPSPATRQ